MRKDSDRRMVEFLTILESASASGHVSGQILASKAGISRSAVWKHVRSLRLCGYGVESVHGLGYRLVRETTAPVPWELKKRLKTSVVGSQIVYRQVADSTQAIAVAIADKFPQADGTVVIAEEQKSGRGRMRRRWFSPPGGLWFSVLLRPKVPTKEITMLPFVAATAVRDAIVETTNLHLDLKWPNDIMVSGKKVAGILLDISAEAEVVNYAVIGIGVNANTDAKLIASRVDSSQAITSLSDELEHEVNRLELAVLILEGLERYLNLLSLRGPSAIIAEWISKSAMLGKRVTVVQNNKPVYEGVASDISGDGSLVVILDSGSKILVTSGDLRVRY